MAKYILRIIASWLVLIAAATNATFFLASYFLDPRSNYTARRPAPDEATIDSLLSQNNLNDETPIGDRWWNWISGIVTRWDWGTTPSGVSVGDEVGARFGVSAQLVLGATAASIVLGVAFGVFAAIRQYSWADRVISGITVVTFNIPAAVAGLIVASLGIWINQQAGVTMFFVTRAQSPEVVGFWPVIIDRAQHAFLPSIAMILVGYGNYYFWQRSMLLDVVDADFVRAARARGLSRVRAIIRHGLRVSMIPVASQVAFALPAVLVGSIVIETIFAWEGMGRYFVTSIENNDIHGVVAVAAFGALLTAIGAVISDTLVVLLDPRVRTN